MLKVDTRELEHYQEDLAALNRRGLPYATRKTLNDLAWKSRSEWQAEIARTFTLRNQFTERSIRVEQAKGANTRDQQSVVGSVAQYMLTQEEGGVLHGKSGQSKPVPTTAARIGGSEKKVVSRPNRMSRIQLRARRGQSQAQRNAIQVMQAQRAGSKFAFIEKGSKRGIFRVMGGKRSLRLRLIQNLSHSTVTIKRQTTMQPAVQRALLWGPSFYRDALQAQLLRAKTYKR